MRHEYWRHHLSDHNSATSGIAPLGTTDPSADPRESQLQTDTLAGLLTVRDSGRNGRQSRAGLRAAKRLLGKRNIRGYARLAACTP
jgi:hypothetical protein